MAYLQNTISHPSEARVISQLRMLQNVLSGESGRTVPFSVAAVALVYNIWLTLGTQRVTEDMHKTRH